MAFANLPGGFAVPIGPNPNITSGLSIGGLTMDAANEAAIFYGRIKTADGASHTIDTTGSSSIGWRAGGVTFANAGSTMKVGIAAVNATVGPPGRAANVADVITFDVAAVFTGGGGGISASVWNSSVPTEGTKTIADGDLVAVALQMTARAGADSVAINGPTSPTAFHLPSVTQFLGGSYAIQSQLPNIIITFSDGTIGWLHGSEIIGASNGSTTWNSGSATKEYGQLYDLPFPCKVYGLYGTIDPDADLDVVLYSDPLGTPVPERTVAIDANWAAIANPRKFHVLFPTPYEVAANQKIGAVFKPGGSSVVAQFKTLANAAHRVADPWGTSGYGISRASGAFANVNSSLDHYYIGLLVGGFEVGGAAGLVAPLFGGGII